MDGHRPTSVGYRIPLTGLLVVTFQPMWMVPTLSPITRDIRAVVEHFIEAAQYRRSVTQADPAHRCMIELATPTHFDRTVERPGHGSLQRRHVADNHNALPLELCGNLVARGSDSLVHRKHRLATRKSEVRVGLPLPPCFWRQRAHWLRVEVAIAHFDPAFVDDISETEHFRGLASPQQWAGDHPIYFSDRRCNLARLAKSNLVKGVVCVSLEQSRSVGRGSSVSYEYEHAFSEAPISLAVKLHVPVAAFRHARTVAGDPPRQGLQCAISIP